MNFVYKIQIKKSTKMKKILKNNLRKFIAKLNKMLTMKNVNLN